MLNSLSKSAPGREVIARAPGLADNKRLAFSRSLASSHPFIAFVALLCGDLHVGLPNFNLIVLFSASHHQRCHSKPFR